MRLFAIIPLLLVAACSGMSDADRQRDANWAAAVARQRGVAPPPPVRYQVPLIPITPHTPYMLPTRGDPVAPASPSGLTGFLQDQSTDRGLRYCRYSNGVVATFSAVDLCPLQTQ